MTPKEQHAEGTRFLAEAVDAMDQAHSCFVCARTAGAVEDGHGPYRSTATGATGKLEGLLKAAREAVCDDCNALIADCKCAWANEEIPK